MTVDRPAKHTKTLTQQKLFGEAIRFAKNWISAHQESDPEYIKVTCALVTCYLKAGNLADAETLGRETIRKFPQDPVAHTSLVQVLMTAGNLADAEKLGRETIRKFPDNPVAHTSLVQVLMTAGNLADAEKLGRETIRKFPDNPVAHTSLVQVLMTAGNLADAEKLGRDTIRRFPQDPVAVVLLCRTLLHSGANMLRESRIASAQTVLQECSTIASALLRGSFHETSILILRRLAELHVDSNDNGVGVKGDTGPTVYDVLITALGVNSEPRFQLRRNTSTADAGCTEELDEAIGRYSRSQMFTSNLIPKPINADAARAVGIPAIPRDSYRRRD
jgi:tetratricopeptide (TPR) repeat protein